jgi:hypothetical protein
MHIEAKRLEPRKHMGLRMVRKAGALFRRTKQREKMVQRLIGRGISPALAELMVPSVGDHGVIIINTGVRATYRYLKGEYKRGRRIRFSD